MNEAEVSMADTAATPGAISGATTTTSFLAGDPSAASGAAASAGAQASSRFFGAHVQKDGVFHEGWSEGLKSAGYERLANKAMLAKDEATFFKSLDDSLAFLGRKNAGGYPKANASEEEIASFRQSAGVPDHADGYQLKPEKLPEGVEWSDDNARLYSEVMHKHHVPAAAAKELLELHVQEVAKQASSASQTMHEKVGKLVEVSEKTFRKEWGQNYDARLEQLRTFVRSRNIDTEDPVMQMALSHPEIVRVFDEARRALREAPLPGVAMEHGTGSMSARQQAREIIAANPNWERQPEIATRVRALYALDAKQR